MIWVDHSQFNFCWRRNSMWKFYINKKLLLQLIENMEKKTGEKNDFRVMFSKGKIYMKKKKALWRCFVGLHFPGWKPLFSQFLVLVFQFLDFDWHCFLGSWSLKIVRGKFGGSDRLILENDRCSTVPMETLSEENEAYQTPQ